MKPSPKQTQEAHQNYKKVSEHLIREGYAPDQESADDIITVSYTHLTLPTTPYV